MKRYCVCKIIGDGVTPETARRAAIDDVLDPDTGLRAFNFTTLPWKTTNGLPDLDWCLVIAAGKDFKLLDGNADVDVLPDYPLDVKVGSMDTETKGEAFAKLGDRGIDVSALGNLDGYRKVIRSLGKEHNVNFNENAFDVSE